MFLEFSSNNFGEALWGWKNGELFIGNVCHKPFQSITPTFIPRFYNHFVVKTAISRKDNKYFRLD